MEFNKLFIPIDIIYNILIKLDQLSSYKFSKTCKNCYFIYADDNQLWHKYLIDFIPDFDDEQLICKNNYKSTFIKYFKINKLKIFYKLYSSLISMR